jgi:hypothetical protein
VCLQRISQAGVAAEQRILPTAPGDEARLVLLQNWPLAKTAR